MLIGTHVLLPVCIALTAECVSLAKGRGHVFPPWGLVLVGAFGALPDVCTPHISLADRHASWSHTVWFLAGMAPFAAMVVTLFEKQGRWWLALACWLAVLLHLIGDAVAGGIAPLYPWRTEVVGDYYIAVPDWMWYEIGFVLLTWVLVRFRPFCEARGIGAGVMPSSPSNQA
ncbi:metal-dependent hydrolase [Luteolibacter flavescens]|uniref:Metal-dependent hydrolase n=1 Tax=Luteolibacter flavescens TaxID=1859460 RepID=A0ABT3FUA9_9BACT|nr:metal-dependent hydrolase [Luteolibacter flavescens]MCW1886806.1 metal-dependent hydrolase [Luteolibacter flavescens]